MTEPKRPSGVWVAVEFVDRQFKFVGVFDSYDLAETACRGCETYEVANVQVGESYRGRVVDWRLTRDVKA
jgi:hypothetical protein